MSGILAQKLAKIRRELKYTQKRGTNTFHHYDYVMAADIAADMGKTLADAGIILTSENLKVTYEQIASVDLKKGPETDARIQITYVLHDTESGEMLRYESAGAGRDRGDKGIYKALTGCFKYFFIQAFIMPIGEDPENDRDERRGKDEPEPTLTDEQCQEVVRLIAMSKSETKKVLDYYKVDNIKDLPYEKVKAALGKKLRSVEPRSTRQAPGKEVLNEAASYPAVPEELPAN